MYYIGIDPGVSGGIAVWHMGEVTAVKMPATEQDVLDAINVATDGLAETAPMRAVIERAIPFAPPGMKMGASSAFTSGRGYGRLLMALTALQIPFDEVMPLKWQTAMGCRTRGDKNVSKRRAQQLFPDLKVTHAIADALLMAEYCRRLHTGALDTTSVK